MNIVDDKMAATIKLARSMGYKCHEISSYFNINQGRISDVMKGRIGRGVPAATNLPPDFPTLH